ncbi:hypothetical protein HDU93_000204 [Gonapodya sp. JEL0774]|nr:hypothetical protein HDU93_000204 [Gonapodya sp. JEL0774]
MWSLDENTDVYHKWIDSIEEINRDVGAEGQDERVGGRGGGVAGPRDGGSHRAAAGPSDDDDDEDE